jgi:hypothetical protein
MPGGERAAARRDAPRVDMFYTLIFSFSLHLR